jgi:hypothetical protein
MMATIMITVMVMVKTNNDNGNGDGVPCLPLPDPPSFFGWVSERGQMKHEKSYQK